MKLRRLRPYLAPPFALHHLSDDRVVTLPIPGYHQIRSYSCGFASALMIARHFRIDIAGEELFRKLGTDRTGTRQTAIIRVLRELGIRVGVRYDADFERIVRGIDAGQPIVGYLGDIERWLVLYGYGRAPDRIFVADPRPGHGCEESWDTYGPRLGRFGIFCARPRPVQLTFDF